MGGCSVNKNFEILQKSAATESSRWPRYKHLRRIQEIEGARHSCRFTVKIHGDV